MSSSLSQEVNICLPLFPENMSDALRGVSEAQVEDERRDRREQRAALERDVSDFSSHELFRT